MSKLRASVEKHTKKGSDRDFGCRVYEGTPQEVAVSEDERRRRLFNRDW